MNGFFHEIAKENMSDSHPYTINHTNLAHAVSVSFKTSLRSHHSIPHSKCVCSICFLSQYHTKCVCSICLLSQCHTKGVCSICLLSQCHTKCVCSICVQRVSVPSASYPDTTQSASVPSDLCPNATQSASVPSAYSVRLFHLLRVPTTLKVRLLHLRRVSILHSVCLFHLPLVRYHTVCVCSICHLSDTTQCVSVPSATCPVPHKVRLFRLFHLPPIPKPQNSLTNVIIPYKI